MADLKSASAHSETTITIPAGLYHLGGHPVRFHAAIEATTPAPSHEGLTGYLADVQGVHRRKTPTMTDGTVDMAALVRQAAEAGAAAALAAQTKPAPASKEPAVEVVTDTKKK